MVPDDPDTIEFALARIAKHMAIPMTIYGKTFTIPSEFLIGYNFGKAGKDGSNPSGLMASHKWLAARRANTLSIGG
jgi:hypothetical protein